MNVMHARAIFIVAFSLLMTGLVTGCGGDKSTKAESGAKTESGASGTKDKEAKWLATYKNSKEGGRLTLQADHKGTLEMSGTKGDITWEVTGDDKIIVHAPFPITMFLTSDGNLRDEEGTVWKKT